MAASLFGWKNIAKETPKKTESPDGQFKEIRSDGRNTVSVCYDTSASTAFTEAKSETGQPFSAIYADALLNLHKQLPAKHEVVCWSNVTTKLEGKWLEIFRNCIEGKAPLASQLEANGLGGMNGGTNPNGILNVCKGQTIVLVTDGEIPQELIAELSRTVPTSGIGNVFLVIVPHINKYPALYNQSVKEKEDETMNSIDTSIPQAFSNRLAATLVWIYKQQKFELVLEMTAKWINPKHSLADMLGNIPPSAPLGEFSIMFEGKFMSFSVEKLIQWVDTSVYDINAIEKLVIMGVADAIKQQANREQKEKWNQVIQKGFQKVLDVQMKAEYQEKPVPADVPMMEAIKIATVNQRARSLVEKSCCEKMGKIFGKLLVEKTLSEVTKIGQAKIAQTVANVGQFQNMKQEDQINTVAEMLTHGTCSVCAAETNVFKTCIIPTDLIVKMKLSVEDRERAGKKGKVIKYQWLNVPLLRSALDENRPALYMIDFCAECAKEAMVRARHPTDPKYGITGFVPQNMATVGGMQRVVNRLLVVPLIAKERMDRTCNPNISQISFCRQWLRGWISETMALNPASQETLLASLCFLSALANSKENAEFIFANQMSLLRGGSHDRYPDTVGRLFEPSPKDLSSETLMLISTVEQVVEMAEIPVRSDCNKLLLLCLVDRYVTPLLTAKKQQERAVVELKKKGEWPTSENPDEINRVLGKYLQDHMGVDVQLMSLRETQLTRVLEAKTFVELSVAFRLPEDQFRKMIERSNMTPEQMQKMVPKFVDALAVAGDQGKMRVIQEFVEKN